MGFDEIYTGEDNVDNLKVGSIAHLESLGGKS